MEQWTNQRQDDQATPLALCRATSLHNHTRHSRGPAFSSILRLKFRVVKQTYLCVIRIAQNDPCLAQDGCAVYDQAPAPHQVPWICEFSTDIALMRSSCTRMELCSTYEEIHVSSVHWVVP